MWYLGVVVVFYIIIFHFKDSKKLDILFILSILFYLTGLYFVTYKYLFINSKLQFGINFINQYYLSNRYAIFTIMFPFIGFYLNKYKIEEKFSIKLNIFFLLMSIICLLFETIVYFSKSLEFIEYDYFIFLPLVSIFLFLLLIKLNKKINIKVNTKYLREWSRFLFFYHYIFIFLFLYYNREFDNVILDLCNNHSSIKFMLIFIDTIIFSLLLKFLSYIFKKLDTHRKIGKNILI